MAVTIPIEIASDDVSPRVDARGVGFDGPGDADPFEGVALRRKRRTDQDGRNLRFGVELRW